MFLLQIIQFYAKSWLPARSIVMECLSARKQIDPSGEIMVLTRSCPVSGNIFIQLQLNDQVSPDLLYSPTSNCVILVYAIFLSLIC